MNTAISLDALRVLDAIERKGSFAAAADSMHRVPSALSYTVAKLEEDLDVQLFDRSGRRARLTPAGQLLLKQGRELLQAVNQLQSAVKQVESGWEAQLTLSRDSAVPWAPVFSLLREFMALERLTEINVREEVMAGGWEALQSGRADIAIGVPVAPAASQFHQIPMGQIHFVFAVSPLHPLAERSRVVSARDVREHTAIIVADSAREMPRHSSGLFDSRRRIVVPDLPAKIEAQKLGLGVGFLPRHMISDELARGELLLKKTSIPREASPLYLAWHRQRDGQALRWFCERLCEYPWQQVFDQGV